jgi:hypothetical protein
LSQARPTTNRSLPRAEWRLPSVFAFLLMTILGVFMFRGFSAFYGGSAHALAGIAPVSTPLLGVSMTFMFASIKGNTTEGRTWFRLGVAILGAFALLAGALPFVPIAGIEKDMARATAGLVIAVIVLLALVASTLRPLWSRRTYLP